MMAAVYWNAYRGLVAKQVRRFLRTWVQSLLPSLVTAVLFMLIFGHFVGRELGAVGGIAYADFLMPGLVMTAVITNAYSNTTLSFFGARLQRHIEEMLIAPMPAWLILAGFTSAGVLRGLLAGALVTALALPFTNIALHHVAAGIGVAVLSAVLFALAGMLNGIYAKSFDDTSVISTFVLTPLIYLGGVFYPIERLPESWQGIAQLNPMVYLIQGFRYSLLNWGEVNLALTFALLSGVTVLVGALAWWLIAKGVRIKA